VYNKVYNILNWFYSEILDYDVMREGKEGEGGLNPNYRFMTP